MNTKHKDELADLARQVQLLCHPPLQPTESRHIQALESFAGYIPTDIRTLYAIHNGYPIADHDQRGQIQIRLLPIEEVLAENDSIIDSIATPNTERPPIVFFWTDDESNWAGIFTEGPLKDYITVVDHDEPIIRPSFSNVLAFYASLIGCTQHDTHDGLIYLPEIPTELPRANDEPHLLDHERTLSNYFLERAEAAQSNDQRLDMMCCALRLIPAADTHKILPLLETDDMFVPELAIEVVTRRQYTPAIPSLVNLARRGRPNGDTAAISALRHWNHPEAQQALESLRGTVNEHLERWLD